jgi:Ca-activated chloride channel family protein
MLVALVLIPLGIGIILAIERRRRVRVTEVGGLGLRTTEATRMGRLRERVPALLFLAAMIVLAVAVARPQTAVSLPRSEGILMLTFDVSGSMAADDLEPSRLDASRGIAQAFVDERPDGVVIGVVAFSDTGLSVQVPTDDSMMLRQSIDRLAPAQGTSIGQGILASLEAIERLEIGTPPEYYSIRPPEPTRAPEPVEPGSHSAAAIVLLTDGENTLPPTPLEAAPIAADRGIRVHTIGIGTAEGTTLKTDGFAVHTQLDEPLLRHIAEISDGTYLALDPDVEEITEAIDTKEVYKTLGRHLNIRREPMEVTSLFAGIGALLLLAGAVTSLATRGRLV